MLKQSKSVSIRLDIKDYEELKKLSEFENRTLSGLIKWVLLVFLKSKK